MAKYNASKNKSKSIFKRYKTALKETQRWIYKTILIYLFTALGVVVVHLEVNCSFFVSMHLCVLPAKHDRLFN